MPDRTCSVDGCDRPTRKREWCNKHYQRWLRHGDPDKVVPGGPVRTPKVCAADHCDRQTLGRSDWCRMHDERVKRHGSPAGRPPRAPAECSVEACGNRAVSRGWCGMHYTRWRRTGQVETTSRILDDDEARFWSKVDKNGPLPTWAPMLGRCWTWLPPTDPTTGYGRLNIGGRDGRNIYAHRFSYDLLVGPIPDGLQIDHLCRVRACVNPQHLEPVTIGENVRRELFARGYQGAA